MRWRTHQFNADSSRGKSETLPLCVPEAVFTPVAKQDGNVAHGDSGSLGGVDGGCWAIDLVCCAHVPSCKHYTNRRTASNQVKSMTLIRIKRLAMGAGP